MRPHENNRGNLPEIGKTKTDGIHDYIYDDLNVLIIYGDDSSHTKTVEEHLNSFKQYLPFNVYYANGKSTSESVNWLTDFDIIIVHYSCRLHDLNYLSENLLDQIRKNDGLKIVFAQDEYDNTNDLISSINFIGTDFYFTAVPDSLQPKIFRPKLDINVTLINNLTGYVSNYLKLMRKDVKDINERKITVAYRGRPLHPKYGSYGYLKWNAGNLMKLYCEKNGVVSDISVSEEERLYWDDWHKLLINSRAMLATPSGSNVFDFDGTLRKKIDKEHGDNSFDNYSKILDQLKPIEEKFFGMGQVSPKIFEMMAFGIVPLIVASRLLPEMKASENYIEVSPDLDNFESVFQQLSDESLCRKIITNNYEIIDSEKYSYKTFIKSLEDLIRKNVSSSRGVDFLTTAYAKKKTKINWLMFPQQNPKKFAGQVELGGRNYETLNYAILPRDSFTSTIQHQLDINSYHDFHQSNSGEYLSELTKNYFYAIKRLKIDPLRKINPVRLLKQELSVLRHNNLKDLLSHDRIHRRFLAWLVIKLPKPIKSLLKKIIV